MKKNFVIAAVSAMMLVGCVQEGPQVPVGQAAVTVRIAGLKQGPVGRMVDTPASGTGEIINESALTGGYIFVLNASGDIIYREALTAAATSGAGQTLNGGAYFDSSSEIYVLGNVTAESLDVDAAELTHSTTYAYAELATLEDILGTSSVVIHNTDADAGQNTDYLEPAMANVDAEPATLNVTGEEATADISLSPLYSRLVVSEVAALITTTNAVLGAPFTVTGVYLDNYLPSFTMSGEGSGTERSNGGSTDFTGVKADWFRETGSWESTGTPSVATAGTSKVWSFHAGPADAVPTLFISMIDAKDPDSGDPLPGAATKYLTITGYTGGSGAFESGKIYKVGRITIANKDQLTDTPNPDAVKITAEIDVVDWEIVNLVPELGE
jgi:hypothetical protein